MHDYQFIYHMIMRCLLQLKKQHSLNCQLCLSKDYRFELICFFPPPPLADFKNLRSLEICGGGLTDTGVKNIKNLSYLRLLNLSQNSNLTDKTLELISGISMISLFFLWCVYVEGYTHTHTQHTCLLYLFKFLYQMGIMYQSFVTRVRNKYILWCS